MSLLPVIMACSGPGARLSPAEVAVIRDLMPGWADGEPCIDPYVATDSGVAGGAAKERWSDQALNELLRDTSAAIDSSAGPAPRTARLCARSQSRMRVAYGRPRIADDTGTVVFVATRLDGRDQPDTFRFVYQLKQSQGKWTVPRWAQSYESVRAYIRGDGCYRLSHPRFVDRSLAGLRVDTVIIRADTAVVGGSKDLPLRRLLPGGHLVGMNGRGAFALWYVTHDTLHLAWAESMQRLNVDLGVVGDSLDGSMHYETDLVRDDPPRVPVRGRRIDCSKH